MRALRDVRLPIRAISYSSLLALAGCGDLKFDNPCDPLNGGCADALDGASAGKVDARRDSNANDEADASDETEGAVGDGVGSSCGASGQLGFVAVFSLEPVDGGAVAVNDIAVCNDGNLWFTEAAFDGRSLGRRIPRIVKMTAIGLMTPYVVPGKYGTPYAITAGPDGRCWFAETADSGQGGATGFGAISAAGVVSEFIFSPGMALQPLLRLTAGPDGNVWGITSLGVAQIKPDGSHVEFAPDGGFFSPRHITAGADNRLWFTYDPGLPSPSRIGTITTAGAIVDYSLADQDAGTMGSPAAIARGDDGKVWFTERASDYPIDVIGRITRLGEVAEYPFVNQPGGLPVDIAPGPDGNLWFVNDVSNGIGRINPQGTFVEGRDPLRPALFDLGIGDAGPVAGGARIVRGSGCDLWLALIGKIVHVTLK